jgi:hypothetical protein
MDAMALAPGEFGTISAIDLDRRALIDSIEIAVRVSRARAALGRAADFEDERIVSWGRLTRDEMLSLAACEQDERHRETLLLEIDELLSGAELRAITLYYSYDGQ